jgi:hypothetical protein
MYQTIEKYSVTLCPYTVSETVKRHTHRFYVLGLVVNGVF